MPNQVNTYLKYANVQMAAEALYDRQNQPPETKFSGTISEKFLTDGNNRASRFTATQAAEFSKDWTVVEHISNTKTGFSGTLFKCLKDDEARGLKKDEFVLSLRSTEFIDDSARDSQATNAMEVREFGWAFGQITDMVAWFDRLQTSGKLTAPATVTGYSLGGHLATALNIYLLEEGRGSSIAGTYTFNGAGVGELKDGYSLSQALDIFKTAKDGGNSGYFKADPRQQPPRSAALRAGSLMHKLQPEASRPVPSKRPDSKNWMCCTPP